jgi:hypothetical protein
VINPAKGFNVVATANTKGKGSDDGRFIGTMVMNEALLDRFSVTMEQEYPGSDIETKILVNTLGDDVDQDFVDRLVVWADMIRRSFYEDAVSEIISTRRLIEICKAFLIFGDKEKALNLCLSRFDTETKTSFTELYGKVDEKMKPKPAAVPSEEYEQPKDEEIVF